MIFTIIYIYTYSWYFLLYIYIYNVTIKDGKPPQKNNGLTTVSASAKPQADPRAPADLFGAEAPAPRPLDLGQLLWKMGMLWSKHGNFMVN